MEYYENRLRTFDTYPPQMVPDKYELAKSGFYYTGLADKVICFRCDIKLKDWEKNDNAMNEHEKWSPNCEYLKMVGVPKRSLLNGGSGFNQNSGITPGMFVRQINPKNRSEDEVC